MHNAQLTLRQREKSILSDRTSWKIYASKIILQRKIRAQGRHWGWVRDSPSRSHKKIMSQACIIMHFTCSVSLHAANAQISAEKSHCLNFRHETLKLKKNTENNYITKASEATEPVGGGCPLSHGREIFQFWGSESCNLVHSLVRFLAF